MRFIGDVHAKFDQYLQLIEGCPASIQVGDFGLGFKPVPTRPPGDHRFIRGNHDNPHLCMGNPHWIPDAHSENGVFFLGGGDSIDKNLRTEGVDWWPDEQLSMVQLYAAMDVYEAVKPRILVTHECASDVSGQLFSHHVGRIENPSRTSQAISSLIYIHRPEIVIFGHWHHAVDRAIDGTRFICLPELGYIDLEIG